MVAWLAVRLVKPFRALRYVEEQAGRLDDLVAPPHDVISPELHAQLLAASPYNSVRLIHPDDPSDAAQALGKWKDEGMLMRESDEAVWVLEDEFLDPAAGTMRQRRGLVARVRLEPYGEGHVLPHERTFPRQKDVRLELLRATRTKLSPIFLLHEGDSPERPERDPDLQAMLAGTESRLWRVTDAGAVDDALALLPGEEEYGKSRRGILYASGLYGANDEMWIPLEAVYAVYPETGSAFLAAKGDEIEHFGWNLPPESFRRGQSVHTPLPSF